MQRSHHLELQQIGNRTMLTAAPRGVALGTDEVHIGIGTAAYDVYGKSVLLSRPQVRELHAWLTRWLAEGWHGVPPVHGPTSADVVEHYRDVAVRERVEADQQRRRAGQRLDAALSLIPADILADQPELAAIAAEHADEWRHLQHDRDRAEQARLTFVTGLHEINQALARRHDLRTRGQAVDDAETTLARVHNAVRTLLERGARPAAPRT
jgi:hypothetical protein